MTLYAFFGPTPPSTSIHGFTPCKEINKHYGKSSSIACKEASEEATRYLHTTFSAHILLKSDIFFTWLSMKLCPPNPGFTDIINTKSTTVNQKKEGRNTKC